MIAGIREFFAPSEETVERYAMIHFSHLLGLPECTLHEVGIYETSEGGYYDSQVSQYVSQQRVPLTNRWYHARDVLTYWLPQRIARPWE